MVLSNEEFEKEVMRLASPKAPFEPTAYYDRDGDCIEFLAKPDDFYAQRIDGILTVYRSRKDDEIMGSVIKGVSSLWESLIQKYPGFGVAEYQDGKVRLAHLFMARLWSKRAEMIVVTAYQTLAEFAGDTDIQVEMDVAC